MSETRPYTWRRLRCEYKPRSSCSKEARMQMQKIVAAQLLFTTFAIRDQCQEEPGIHRSRPTSSCFWSSTERDFSTSTAAERLPYIERCAPEVPRPFGSCS